ncbi:PIG-L family deacetylase [Rhizobium sp. BK418]|uniref:PIG-L family deacetylase n=1 Tax=Rhizobium sp. BK418 TaxID=2512120 RepID=UPI0010520EA5|nr:PIG-L family deacetylase [Rhizobium sp. BK418]TCS08731.1 GlcNAc-PI de-N-acetylase [Rhizobium sp. BK418]
MLTDRDRIEKQKQSLSLVRLHRALSRLTSTVTMMNTGAHPDDEHNGLLAYLRLGLGMRVIVACSTRGEGGQNALGPERLGALGIVRSREMEEAARELDADIHWLGHGPEDPIHDFGFSKNGDRTFDRWGEKRIVERLVRAYRAERPDIVLPTFLDGPGQHGHHRAMTRAAETAIHLAADPVAFSEHFGEGLTPWQVAKFYLPAWPGGGDTYDDEVPPPATTLPLDAAGLESVSGVSYAHIGEWSRYYHASQGMGRWHDIGDNEWPLHLKLSARGSVTETSILESLPSTLADLAREADLRQTVVDALMRADGAISKAIERFPERSAIVDALLKAAAEIERALAEAPAAFLDAHGHRLRRKLVEIDVALCEAEHVFVRAVADPADLSPGSIGKLTLHLSGDACTAISDADMRLPEGVSASLKETSPHRIVYELKSAADAPLTRQFLPVWSSLGGNGNAFVAVRAQIGSRLAEVAVDLEELLVVAPQHSLSLQPNAFIVPVEGDRQELLVKAASAGRIGFSAPAGWTIKEENGLLRLSPPAMITAGLVAITPLVDGQPAMRTSPIAYPHIGRTSFREPELLRVLALDLKLPDGAKIGYVGGGADRVGLWLDRMGLDVTELDAQTLSGDLSRFTTIVIGIFAFGIRKDLAAATARLHRFVEEGGHLLTLYHRPSDGWRPDATPPRRIDIGSPSLRWRVTDPTSEVTVLEPTHPLLQGPNRITSADWDGWDKERGLYFAARWDDAYVPLVAMHDPEEQPLKGALLSAEIGKGRHTHTSLVLHHQLDKLTSGAFRLIANLVQPA